MTLSPEVLIRHLHEFARQLRAAPHHTKPMTISSTSLIRDLQELAQQISAVPQHAEALHAAFQGHSTAHAFVTHLDANRHVCAMAATVGSIKAQVVPRDGLGAVVDSISELVLRAQRSIVLTELGALRDIASEPSTRGRLTALAFSPFEQLEDWIGHVGHEVNGIAQWWIDYRGQLDERVEYRAALRKAHAAMRYLAERSKATPFLLDAMVRTDWPALQAPCSRISVALTIPIDVDPDMPLLVIAPRSSELVAERLRRPRSDTRPGTPSAMAIEASDTDRVMSNGAPVPVASADPALENEHR